MYHSRWKGNHFNAGFCYGNRLHENNKIINFESKLTSEKIKYAKKVFDIYNQYYPEIIEEIKGFSEGQRKDFFKVFAFLVSMYVFTYNNFCSLFAIKNDDDIILARNSDFFIEIEKLTDSAFYKLDTGFSFVGNTTAMIQMEDGINEKGLSCGLTFVYPTVKDIGFNAGFLVRYILEKCETAEQVAYFLEKIPVGSSQNIIVIDRFGKIVTAELNCNKKNISINSKNNIVSYRTNHFVSKDMIKYKYIGEDDVFSHKRYKTFELQKYSKYGIDDIFNLFKGKYGFMCQYDRKKNFDTIWSSVYDIKNKAIYRCEGNPRRKKYNLDKRMRFSY